MSAVRPKWLPSSGPGNMNVPPEKWGMSVKQWAAFIMACALCLKWEELEESTDKKEAGYVNLYQVCDSFVKPWTRGTGNSIALLMNACATLKAQLMVSHAWGECLLESLTAVLGKCSVLGMSLDTAIWFCTFAQYQPGDMEGDCGPGVAAQLALDPFKRVIESKPRFGMLVIHTSKAELYDRLWCVYEVNEAEASGVMASAALSMPYMCHGWHNMHSEEDLRVDTETADCWSPDDAAKIRAKVMELDGGFDMLNEKIFLFRRSSAGRTFEMFKEFAAWFAEKDGESPEASIDFIVLAVRKAAQFIGLHCLAPLIEATDDEESGMLMVEWAREIITHFTGDGFSLPEGCPPPPRFDVNKCISGDERPDVDGGPEEIFEALRSLEGFGRMMVGLLEMGAGGSDKLDVVDAAGFDKDDKSSLDKVKAIFRQWDSDGSGKVDKEELAAVLMQLNPSFNPQDIDTMFNSADSNQDGVIDYNEFVDWLGQEFD